MYTQEISSLQHPIVKHLVKLRQDKSYRAEKQSCLVAGNKLICELSIQSTFHTLFIAKGYTPPVPLKAKQTFIVPDHLMKKVTGLTEPESLAAEIALPMQAPLTGISKLLVLDGISDPGNLGTLLRTALALNWEGVFLTPHTSDPFNEKALRSAKGATFKLPLRSGSYQELLDLTQREGLHLIIAEAKTEAAPLPPPPYALVLGNESHGVCELLKTQGTWMSISINPQIESLNVAAAGAILMDRLSRGSHV